MKLLFLHRIDCSQISVFALTHFLFSFIVLFFQGVISAADSGELAGESLVLASDLNSPSNSERNQNLPEELRFDPIFIKFPDLFTDPIMQSSSFEDYEAKKIKEYRALYDAGRSELKQEEYERATRNFSQLIKEAPPVEFRRQALLQLALVANKQRYYDREFQIYSQYLSRFPDDHNCALVNLRMGQLLRDQMGAMDQAIEQFFTVISVTTKTSDIEDDYQLLMENIALKAKIELANTYRDDGQFDKAGRNYKRLLTQQHGDDDLAHKLDRPAVHFEVINSYFEGENWKKVIDEGSEFLKKREHLSHDKAPDIRFFMAKAYLNQGLDDDAASQLMMIMDTVNDPQQEDLKGWQLKIGKELGQIFIKKEKPESAVEIYEGLLSRLPDVLSHLTAPEQFVEEVDLYFHTAMLKEKLKDNEKALEFYDKIIKLTTLVGEKNLGSKEAEIRKFSEEQAKLLKWLIEMDSTPSQ